MRKIDEMPRMRTAILSKFSSLLIGKSSEAIRQAMRKEGCSRDMGGFVKYIKKVLNLN